MMNLMKASFDDLNALPSNDDYHTIIFKNSLDQILSRVPFDPINGFVSIISGEDAVFEFRSISGDPKLQAGMVDGIPVNGTVTNFEVLGNIGGVAIPVLEGSVGTSVNQDIRFNIISWDQSTFLTLTSFRVSLKEGS